MLFAQGTLILAHTASLPFQVPVVLSNMNSQSRALGAADREFMSAWMWLGAATIGTLYLTIAIVTLTAAWRMRERSKWGWELAIAGRIVGFTLACMPFGLYAVWVLNHPAVRAAMKRPA